LNRLELTPSDATQKSRYKKIVYDKSQVGKYFVEMFLKSTDKQPSKIVLDLDATDDPLFGNQEGKFYHGYYGCYCYLPLYIFCGDQLLCAKLRESGIDGSAGSKDEVERIVKEIRKEWPTVRIILRGDSGFCREELMFWCEENEVEYIFGLSKNKRLKAMIEQEEEAAKQKHIETGKAVRAFKDMTYKTLKSWSKHRRVIAKAEYLSKGANPRFVVTSLKAEEFGAKELYEKQYCARGDMENRIKEQQLYLFADRTSTETMRANQLRLWFSSIAYILLNELKRVGLQSTEMSGAQCHTIRNKLLKIGAQVRISVRRVFVSFASGCPYQDIYQQVYRNLRKAYPLIC